MIRTGIRPRGEIEWHSWLSRLSARDAGGKGPPLGGPVLRLPACANVACCLHVSSGVWRDISSCPSCRLSHDFCLPVVSPWSAATPSFHGTKRERGARRGHVDADIGTIMMRQSKREARRGRRERAGSLYASGLPQAQSGLPLWTDCTGGGAGIRLSRIQPTHQTGIWDRQWAREKVRKS